MPQIFFPLKVANATETNPFISIQPFFIEY